MKIVLITLVKKKEQKDSNMDKISVVFVKT